MVILPQVSGHRQMERWRTGLVAKGGEMTADGFGWKETPFIIQRKAVCKDSTG